jgi:hypothetical protein
VLRSPAELHFFCSEKDIGKCILGRAAGSLPHTNHNTNEQNIANCTTFQCRVSVKPRMQGPRWYDKLNSSNCSACLLFSCTGSDGYGSAPFGTRGCSSTRPCTASTAALRGHRTLHTVWGWHRESRRVAFPGQTPQSGLGESPSLHQGRRGGQRGHPRLSREQPVNSGAKKCENLLASTTAFRRKH